MTAMETLSQEYGRTAQLLEARIGELRAAQKKATGMTAMELQKRIDTLYYEMLDVRRTMRYLADYYRS